MSAAILEIQRESMDRTVPLSDLLRKAFVVAKKLGLEGFQQWIQAELNGYERGDDFPPYRKVSGQVRGWNPYHGWIPVIWESAREEEAASQRLVGQSVAELEQLAPAREKESQLHMPLPHSAQRSLSASAGFDTNFSLFVSPTEIVRILDAVRNTLLNWSLKLEEDGILGEGLSFTEEEKETASGRMYSVNNFYGAVGTANVQQAGRDAVRVSVNIDLEALRRLLPQLKESDLELDDDASAELTAEIATVEAQLQSPRPKRGVVKQAAESIRSILEGAGGGVAGHLAIELGKILAGI